MIRIGIVQITIEHLQPNIKQERDNQVVKCEEMIVFLPINQDETTTTQTTIVDLVLAAT
jgi:hypothetical protein